MLFVRYSVEWFYSIFKIFLQRKMPDFQYAYLLNLLVIVYKRPFKISFLNYGIFMSYNIFLFNFRPCFIYFATLSYFLINYNNNLSFAIFYFKAFKKSNYIIKNRCNFFKFYLKNKREKVTSIFYYIIRFFKSFQLTQVKLLYNKYRYCNKIKHLFLKILFFNIIVRKNTAFLQCVHPTRNIIFTITSTQFGFLKFKRYAKFIFDFFFILAFSFFFELKLIKIGFNLILNPFFRLNNIVKNFYLNAYYMRKSFFCRYETWFNLKLLFENEAVAYHNKIVIQSSWLLGLRFKYFFKKTKLYVSIVNLISVAIVFFCVFFGFGSFPAFDLRKICIAFKKFFKFKCLGINLKILYFDYTLYLIFFKRYINYIWNSVVSIKIVTFLFLKFVLQFLYKVVYVISIYFKKRFLRFGAIFCKTFYDRLLFLFFFKFCLFILFLFSSFCKIFGFIFVDRWFFSFLFIFYKKVERTIYFFYKNVIKFVFYLKILKNDYFVKCEFLPKFLEFQYKPTYPVWDGTLKAWRKEKNRKKRYLISSFGKALNAGGLSTLSVFTVTNKRAFGGCRLEKNRRKKMRGNHRKNKLSALHFFQNYIAK